MIPPIFSRDTLIYHGPSRVEFYNENFSFNVKYSVSESVNAFLKVTVGQTFFIFLSATPFETTLDLHTVDFLVTLVLPNYRSISESVGRCGSSLLEAITKLMYFNGLYINRSVSMKDIKCNIKKITSENHYETVLKNSTKYINYLMSVSKGKFYPGYGRKDFEHVQIRTTELNSHQPSNKIVEAYVAQDLKSFRLLINQEWRTFYAKVVHFYKNIIFNMKSTGVLKIVKRLLDVDATFKIIFATEITGEASLSRQMAEHRAGIHLASSSALVFPNATAEQLVDMYHTTSKIVFFKRLVTLLSSCRDLPEVINLKLPVPPPLELLRRMPISFIDAVINELGPRHCVEITNRHFVRLRDHRNPGCYFVAKNPTGGGSNTINNALYLFNNDEKVHGVIVSGKGSTGISMQDSRDNLTHGHRIHIFGDCSYSPTTFLQHVGRSNRTNQLSKPTFLIPSLGGNHSEDRFISILKRRLGNVKSSTGSRYNEHLASLPDEEGEEEGGGMDFVDHVKIQRIIVTSIFILAGGEYFSDLSEATCNELAGCSSIEGCKFTEERSGHCVLTSPSDIYASLDFCRYLYWNRKDILAYILQDPAFDAENKFINSLVFWSQRLLEFMNEPQKYVHDKQVKNMILTTAPKFRRVVHDLNSSFLQYMLQDEKTRRMYFFRKNTTCYGLINETKSTDPICDEDNDDMAFPVGYNIYVKVINEDFEKYIGARDATIILKDDNSILFNEYATIFKFPDYFIMNSNKCLLRLITDFSPRIMNYKFRYAIITVNY